ncbi:hypothetical protein ZIOFF_001293 [Zingiber officinale]|uniref:Peptidase M16 C-terminal domain-containing protein n=1 Tax=Zingiber officinale TaxID=94328 RepID=A0A8J5HV74_ZINOF|nr:hypothetical protein ZIOFF_001293 [Zingiber officinale]
MSSGNGCSTSRLEGLRGGEEGVAVGRGGRRGERRGGRVASRRGERACGEDMRASWRGEEGVAAEERRVRRVTARREGLRGGEEGVAAGGEERVALRRERRVARERGVAANPRPTNLSAMCIHAYLSSFLAKFPFFLTFFHDLITACGCEGQAPIEPNRHISPMVEEAARNSKKKHYNRPIFKTFIGGSMKLKTRLGELSSNPHGLLLEAVHSVGYSGALANPLIAPESTISHLNGTILEGFVSENYTAPRIVLATSGVEHEELVSLAESLLSDLPKVPRPQEPKSFYVGGEYRCQSDLPSTHIALAFEIPGGWHQKKEAMAATVLQVEVSN